MRYFIFLFLLFVAPTYSAEKTASKERASAKSSEKQSALTDEQYEALMKKLGQKWQSLLKEMEDGYLSPKLFETASEIVAVNPDRLEALADDLSRYLKEGSRFRAPIEKLWENFSNKKSLQSSPESEDLLEMALRLAKDGNG